jgi:hypothetical protein
VKLVLILIVKEIVGAELGFSGGTKGIIARMITGTALSFDGLISLALLSLLLLIREPVVSSSAV